MHRCGAQISLLAACVVLVVSSSSPARGLRDGAQECDWTGPRVDCGDVGTTQEECERQGCCWSPSKFEDFVPVDLPWCFQKNNGSVVYALRGAQSTDTSVHGVLELQHGDFLPALGEDAPALDASLVLVAPTIARLTLLPRGGKPRWRVPTSLLNSPFLHSLEGTELPPENGRASDAAPTEWVRLGIPPTSSPDGGPTLFVEYRAEPFALRVLAPSNGPTPRELFSTDAKRLAARDQYLEWLARVPANATLFGAGERGSRTMRLRRNGAPRPIWARDIGPTLLEQNMYGAHPFVLALEPEGLAWGVFLLNSNAMDVVPSADSLAFRTTGGVLDFFFFLGPEPQDVMEQYTRVVGRPAMVPYWALGWHQSKYGYASVSEMREVVANYSAVGLPLETLWADIDHMDKWKDFTFDPVSFPLQGMQDLVRGLHENQQRFVPIVDPGIKVEQGYQPYEMGLEQGLFVKGVDNKNPYLGWVWPGPCHFPDFAHPPTQQYFTDALAEHHKNLDFDGIWIDMDEASNFCTGDVCVPRSSPENVLPMRPLSRLTKEPQWVCHLECSEARDLSPEQRALRHPPYDVSNGMARAPLGEKVISVLARRVDGSWEYDAHNLYGLAEVRVTHAAMESVRGRRPFVLSRASWAGTGAYAAHWTGDNEATWEQLRMSIPGMLNIGLFGMPMAGVDICGFQKNTTMELCSRWTSLGAFYPFSRSHSDLHSTRQELYLWPQVIEAGRRALGLRYRLLPTLYSLFRLAHERGWPVARPLWMSFPQLRAAHAHDASFTLGDAVLVTPVLEEGSAEARDALFPPGIWYDAFRPGREGLVDARASPEGLVRSLPAPLGHVPVHVRGGSVLALGAAARALRTAHVRDGPLVLVAALGGAEGRGMEANARGWVYVDGGEELEPGRCACHFARVDVRVWRADAQDLAGGEAQLAFELPDGFRAGDECGSAMVHWPGIAGLHVWDWEEARAVPTVTVTVRRGGTERAAEHVLERKTVSVSNGVMELDLQALHLRLRCTDSLAISWLTGTGDRPVARKAAW